MVDQTSQMFITGPDVIKTVTGEDVTMEDLGGARTHNTKSGVAHFMARRRGRRASSYVKALLSYLPSNNIDEAAGLRRDRHRLPRAATSISTRSSRTPPTSPTTCTTVIEHLLDDGEFLEVHALFAPNIVVGFGRIEGHPVGVVANQPMHFAGTLDIDASEKAARFVRTCDAFNLPVLTFVDVPGFLPGTDQEWQRHHPPRRQADLRLRRGDRPEGHGHHPQGLRRRVRRHGLQAPRRRHQPRLAHRRRSPSWARRARSTSCTAGTLAARGQAVMPSAAASSSRDYEDRFANPYIAAERGYVDAVIAPSETRAEVIKALRLLRTKRESLPPKKHGNIPL